MKKKIGQRFKSMFDELDGMILIEIFKNPQGILELTKKLNVEHKTAKKHIDKLERYRLISIIPKSQNKKLLILTPTVTRFIIDHESLLRGVYSGFGKCNPDSELNEMIAKANKKLKEELDNKIKKNQ